MVQPVCSSDTFKVRDIDSDGKPETIVEHDVCREDGLIVSGEQELILSSGKKLSDLTSVMNGYGRRISVFYSACNSGHACFNVNRLDSFFVADPPQDVNLIQDEVDILVHVTDEGNGGQYLMDVDMLERESISSTLFRKSRNYAVENASRGIALFYDAVAAAKVWL